MTSSALSFFRNRHFHICLLFLALAGMTRCAHDQVKGEDPDALFAEAEEAFKDERYLVAVEKYRDLKNRYPYSARAVDSELRIADAYFAQESYLEAESAYEIFKELHPSHPKSDYVQYQIAMSYYYQIPDNPQRDLSAAYKTIDAFETLLSKYPTSEFAPKAKEYMAESRKKLAEYEHYVADFYFRREHFLSASYRFASLLHEFPKLGYDEEALYKLGACYFQTRMYENARATLQQLLTEYPQSEYKSQASAVLEQVQKKSSAKN